MVDLLNKKEEKLEKIEKRIRALNREKSKLTKEIELIKMKQDLEKYRAIEIALKEKGMSIEELIKER